MEFHNKTYFKSPSPKILIGIKGVLASSSYFPLASTSGQMTVKSNFSPMSPMFKFVISNVSNPSEYKVKFKFRLQ